MKQPKTRISAKSYTTGFLLSLALTLAAYFAVRYHVSTHHDTPSDNVMIITLTVLAISQLLVQLVFFLHLSKESKPRWNLAVLSFAAMVVIILVFGSLWIMNNLDYHHSHLTPKQTTNYIIHDEGIQN